MNAKLLILAILTAVILVLFMSASAPGQDRVPAQDTALRRPLGGDCSADRATGDLYHISDPYCIVQPGTPAPVSVALEDRGDRMNDGTRELPLVVVTTTNDKQGADQAKHRKHDNSDAEIDEHPNNPGDESSITLVDVPSDDPSIDNPTAPANDETKPHSDDHLKPPTGGQDSNQDDHKSDAQVKDPPKHKDNDQNSADKKCKKEGRDNVNSQGNDNCSGNNPDANSGQERNKDYDQHENGSDNQGNDQANNQHSKDKSSDKECKKGGGDNLNSQDKHDCSADNPDISSDQQRTTDHGPSDQHQDGGRNKDKDKKDH